MLKNKIRKDPNDNFLGNVSGVIHVGANTGQERYKYRNHSLHVIWIEPIPDVFHRLQENLLGFEKQHAFQALATDVDDREYVFHISNNDGLSSSTLELKKHKDIWPDVDYVITMILKSTRLETLLKRNNINAKNYQALVLDTQGSGLLVLQGCGSLLQQIQFIKTEVPDFESYEGCCRLSDILAFMEAHGFEEISRYQFADNPEQGNYYDVLYQRIQSPALLPTSR